MLIPCLTDRVVHGRPGDGGRTILMLHAQLSDAAGMFGLDTASLIEAKCKRPCQAVKTQRTAQLYHKASCSIRHNSVCTLVTSLADGWQASLEADMIVESLLLVS